MPRAKKKIYPKSTIGKQAKIIALDDECAEPKYLGQIGVITDLNTNRQTGNTPEYPLIEILFSDGVNESYWPDEIEIIK